MKDKDVQKSIINKINSPCDLKKLKRDELEILCAQIRELIIETVAVNGGHLAPNLGVVELTVALHREFNSPKDKFVFDVGHQCYTHKILTGRREKFGTLRKKGGISGFPKPGESEHDAFISGHSSTAISVACGIAANNKDYTVAIVGDGALTGGLAFEGLNNAGRMRNQNLIVILNDNTMSIGRNVGALARYLAAIRARPGYVKFKRAVEKILLKIPFLGKFLHRIITRIKTSIKNALYRSTLFEDMGFTYLGPIDGHDLKSLDTAFKSAKVIKRPVLVHVVTKKGKGYSFAEKTPDIFHGVGGFNAETGEVNPSKIDYSAIFGDELAKIASEDEKIVAITAAMCEGCGLYKFKQDFKDRFYDVGIAEGHAITFAAGMSSVGKIPVFSVYSSFLQRGFDQILHDAAISNQRLILAIDRAGFVNDDGETHQGLYDVSMLSTVPNVTIFSPGTFEDLKVCLRAAIYDTKGIAAVRYPKGAEVEIPLEYTPSSDSFDIINLGEKPAKIAILTYGRMFANAATAALQLKEHGVNIDLLKLNKIHPIGDDFYAKLAKYDEIVALEEGNYQGGIVQKISAKLLDLGFGGKCVRVGVSDEFTPQCTVDEAIEMHGLDVKSIVEKVLKGRR